MSKVGVNVTVIGLTGGIASGKSTVAKYLADNGFIIVDADIASRKAVEAGSRVGFQLWLGLPHFDHWQRKGEMIVPS